MLRRLAPPLALLALLAGAEAARAQITGLRGLRDHTLCCAIGMPSLHGADGSFDPAPDPVLSRHRAPAPPPPAAEPAKAVAAPTELPPLKAPETVVEGHLEVGFDFLGGYPLALTQEQAAAVGAGDQAALAAVNAQIPDLVRALDGKRVMVTGYMLPMKMEGTLTTEFLLVANSMLCCYGVVPPMNQWLTVAMTKGGAKPQQDVPTQVFGTLRVRTRIENGALTALYHLEGDRVRLPK